MYNEIAHHILNDDYTQAIEKLEPLKNEEKAAYWLSLLYRSQWGFHPELAKFGYEEYLKEKELVENIPFENEYFTQRKTWHALPYHERSEPRPCRNEEPDPAYPLSPEILENMTFVSFSSSAYFEKLVELIESVQCIETYKNIPWNIITPWGDELSDNQKHILMTQYGVKEIAKPDFKKLFPDSTIDFYKKSPRMQYIATFGSRHNLFPNYTYYFDLQADVWINNRCAIDYYIALGEKYDAVYSFETAILFHKNNSEYTNLVSNFCKNYFENNLHLVDKKIRDRVFEHGFWLKFVCGFYGDDQDARITYSTIIISQVGIYLLNEMNKFPNTHNYGNEIKKEHCPTLNPHCPIFKSNDIYIYSEGMYKKLCAIHQPHHYRKIIREEAIKDENLKDLEYHHGIFSRGIGNQEDLNTLPQEYSIWYPFRYRILPWQKISAIKEILKQEALNYAENKKN